MRARAGGGGRGGAKKREPGWREPRGRGERNFGELRHLGIVLLVELASAVREKSGSGGECLAARGRRCLDPLGDEGSDGGVSGLF